LDQEDKEQKARERESHQKRLEQSARVALGADGAEALIEELRRIAMSNAYAPGRTKADMAFADGKRAAAAHILSLGGVENG